MDYTMSVTSQEVSRDVDELVKRDEELVEELSGWVSARGLAGFTTDRAVGLSFDITAASIEQAATLGIRAVRQALTNLGLPSDPRAVEIQIADEE